LNVRLLCNVSVHKQFVINIRCNAASVNSCWNKITFVSVLDSHEKKKKLSYNTKKLYICFAVYLMPSLCTLYTQFHVSKFLKTFLFATMPVSKLDYYTCMYFIRALTFYFWNRFDHNVLFMRIICVFLLIEWIWIRDQLSTTEFCKQIHPCQNDACFIIT